MTDYHVAVDGDDAASGHSAYPWQTLRHALSRARGGTTTHDVVNMHGGVYPEAISTYETPVYGGQNLTHRLIIRAWPGGGAVTLRPSGGDRVVTLAKAVKEYVELRDLELDATSVAIDCVKATNTGSDPTVPAPVLRLRGCEIHHAPGQGALVTQRARLELLSCKIHHNGTSTQLDHGAYLSTSGNVMEDCDVWANAAYGVQVHRESGSGCDDNQIIGNRFWDHAEKSGALVGSGNLNIAHRNTCWGNAYGVFVYRTAVDARVTENTLYGNRFGSIYVAPEAIGTYRHGNEPESD